MAVPLILTAAGEFAAPYLIKEATKLGIKKFIQNYGSTAFQSIAAGVTGGMIAQETPPLDLQQEKLFGMPVSHIAGQGKVYSDITEPKKEKPLEYIETVHGGTGPLEPIKAEPFPIETKVEPIQEGFEKPEPIETTKGFEVPSEKKIVPPGFEKPEPLGTDILTKDVTKQTKDLVTKEPEFGALTEVEKQTALLEKEGKPDFYSRAVESIKNAKDDKYTKGKWASILKSSTTKEELNYLGLTEFLKGNESVTKKELLDFVKGKDIAATMVVRSIPKDQMNPMYQSYSLGGEKIRTSEHIVFQIPKGKWELIDNLYQEPHFDTEYGTGTFAHARVQVGYSPADAIVDKTGYNPNLEEDLEKKENINISELFDNTLIIDEIQSQWIQEIQNSGIGEDWKVYRGDKLKLLEVEKEEFEKQKLGYILRDHYYVFDGKNNFVNSTRTDEEAYEVIENKAVPDLPLKDSKKFVELILNEMIRKAVKDGRDSIAITNGQIQYNRYIGEEEKKKGLKKFYDTFVYDQLNKIAKNYGVELERIDIQDPEQVEMDQQDIQLRIPKTVKEAQDNDLYLQKITLQELWDRIKDTYIPDHTPLYSNQGRGQGNEYIAEWVSTLVDNREIPFSETTEENLSDRGVERWDKIRHNEVYVWKVPTSNIDEEGTISWDMPIVPVADTITNPAVKDLLNASKEDREHILKSFNIGGERAYPYEGENINNIDLIKYTEYLRNYKPPEGVDLGYDKDVEQLIKMKLPKKLQKDILSKSIRLTKKIDEQTQRLVA